MRQQPAAQFTALVLSVVVTLAMLGSVDRLATAQPPAGLVAQVAHASTSA